MLFVISCNNYQVRFITCLPQWAQALVEHPDVDLVSFTGSSETGAFVGATCGRTHKRVCDVFTEWKSVYVDFSGSLQRTQIDNRG